MNMYKVCCKIGVTIDHTKLAERFWDLFIVDAFIGNWDRHNGDWGFLYNTQTDEMELAPMYDYGSSLYPQTGIETNRSPDRYEKIQALVEETPMFGDLQRRFYITMLTARKACILNYSFKIL